MLTLKNIFDIALFDLGIENAQYAPPNISVQVLGYVKGAMQFMQTAGVDYYSRQEIDISLVQNQSAYPLAKTVQTVLDGARINGKTLMRISSRPMFDNFGPLFLGQDSRSVATGEPCAYFVQSFRDVADTTDANNVQVTILVTPAPSLAGTLTVPVIQEPPTYTLDDLIASPTVVPPVPHQYHESILLPIVRFLGTSHPFFDRHKDRFPRIEADYQQALIQLGVTDPRQQPGGIRRASQSKEPQQQQEDDR